LGDAETAIERGLVIERLDEYAVYHHYELCMATPR
jgi:hypothetical protein